MAIFHITTGVQDTSSHNPRCHFTHFFTKLSSPQPFPKVFYWQLQCRLCDSDRLFLEILEIHPIKFFPGLWTELCIEAFSKKLSEKYTCNPEGFHWKNFNKTFPFSESHIPPKKQIFGENILSGNSGNTNIWKISSNCQSVQKLKLGRFMAETA